MSKAQTDIRRTSFDAASHRPEGYQGTIDDVLAQIRAEDDVPPRTTTARQELLEYLGVEVRSQPFSGYASHGINAVLADIEHREYMEREEDDSVVYGSPEAPKPAEEAPSFYSLAYAQQFFPQSFAKVEG